MSLPLGGREKTVLELTRKPGREYPGGSWLCVWPHSSSVVAPTARAALAASDLRPGGTGALAPHSFAYVQSKLSPPKVIFTTFLP